MNQIISHQRTAAIGIAGARGSGKTTLIEWFTKIQSRVPVPHRWTLSVERRVFVSAPVQYDTRDFLLYLFAEVCHSIIGRPSAVMTGTADHARPKRIAQGIARTAYSLLLRVLLLIAGLSTIYMSYLLLVKYSHLQLELGPLRQAFALTTLAWASFNLALVANTIRADGLPFFIMLNRLKRPDRPLLLLGFLAAIGAISVPFYDLRYHSSWDDYTLSLIVGACRAFLASVALWRASYNGSVRNSQACLTIGQPERLSVGPRVTCRRKSRST